MSKLKKYRILLGIVLIAFLYVLSTEVTERWSQTTTALGELSNRKDSMLKPEVIAARKDELLLRRAAAKSQLATNSEAFEQSQIGLIKFLNSTAGTSKVLIQSLTPSESQTSGQTKEIQFKIDGLSTYHRLGTFVNEMEDGGFRIQLTKLELTPQKAGSSLLQLHLEGKSTVLAIK